MEMATAHQPLLTAAHLQALGTDPMLYQGRVSAWQPVVANMPPVTEIPKESIIANTDFTTTSLIAKRRLSSKRRRKLNLEGASRDGGCSENTRRSPVCFSTASPSNTSNTCTPSSVERRMDIDAPRGESSSTAVAVSVSSQPALSSNHTSGAATVPVLPSSLVDAPSCVERAGVSNSSMSIGGQHPVGVIPSHHTGFHQYLHKADVLYLQDQSLLQQQQAKVPQASSSDSAHSQPICSNTQPKSTQGTLNIRNHSGFKWCKAHVAIAKQIQIHKQKKTEAPFSSHTRQTNSPACSVQQTASSHASSNMASVPPQPQSQHVFAPPQQQQQQQQHITTTATSTPQIALMQYNLPAANNVMATAAAAPAVAAATASAYPPGYLAMPYSSMQELQMRMQQPSLVPIPAAQLQQLSNGGIQVMKPVMAISDNNVVGLNLGLQMIGGVNGGLHPSLQQQPHLASLAAPGQQHHLAHTPSAGVLPGPGTWGVAPVFNHTFQPGIMATPWVK